MTRDRNRCLLLDWGNTLMRDLPEFEGPMCAWPRVEAVPYASETLSELHPSWVTALATNAGDSGEAEIRKALERAGLNGLIDRIYSRRDLGVGKPSPRFFDQVAKDLKFDRSQIVMVGDDFETDVLGAEEAGLFAIWFNEFSAEAYTGDRLRTIHDLRSLPEALWVLLERGVP